MHIQKISFTDAEKQFESHAMEDQDTLQMLEIPKHIKVPSEADVKEAIWKTVQYVKRNGEGFENKLEGANFSFLQKDSIYHDYYNYLLSRSLDNHNEVQIEDVAETLSEISTPRDERVTTSSPQVPYSFVFSTYDKNVSQRDLEIMKTTALYCVVNEQSDYLSLLRDRYEEDELFAFLNPGHSLNSTFTSFINQYKQVISGEFGSLIELGKDFKYTLLQRSFKRAEYQEFSLKMDEEQKRVNDKFRLKFSAYSWEKFKTVGTVTFNDDDISKELSKPLDFLTLSHKSLRKSELDTFTPSNIILTSQITDPAKKDDNVGKAKSKKKAKMKIRAEGETRLKKNSSEGISSLARSKLIECPITHKLIPEEKFDRHIQVLLSDPNFIKEREVFKAKHKLTNLTSEGVHQNIKRLSREKPKNITEDPLLKGKNLSRISPVVKH